MGFWTLALAVAATGLSAAVLLVMRKPIALPFAYIAWGCAVFTSEAGLAGAGATAGALTAPKLLPLIALVVTATYFVLQPRRPGARALNPPFRWALAYVAWLGFCSVFAPSTVNGGVRVAQIGLPLLAIIAARLHLPRPAGFVVTTVLGCGAHVFYAVFIDQDYVGLVGEQRLTGLLIANTFGLAAGLTLSGAFGYWIGRSPGPVSSLLLWATIGICGYALVQAAARTAAIAILVALLVAIRSAFRSRTSASRWRAAISVLALAAVGFYVVYSPRIVTTTTQLFVRGNTDLGHLTGRIPLWRHLSVAIEHRPLTGYGPAAFRDRSIELTRFLTPSEASLSLAHNALVEATVSGGVLGGVLWLSFMVSLGRHLGRLPDELGPAASCLFTICAVSALTSSSGAGIGLGWYMALALAALISPSGGHESAAGQTPRLASLAPVTGRALSDPRPDR